MSDINLFKGEVRESTGKASAKTARRNGMIPCIVYGDKQDPTGQLVEDFHLVPIINFCKETATFPSTTFITQDFKSINTYFSYAGESNK